MYRTMLYLFSIIMIALSVVLQPNVPTAYAAEQTFEAETSNSSPPAQTNNATTHVRLVIDQITSNRQTNGDQGGFLGTNDVDEVYFLVGTGDSFGSNSSVRLPGEDDYYALTTAKVDASRHTRTNIQLWEGDLHDGETVVVHVVVREQDNEELFAVLGFIKNAGASLASILSSLVGDEEVETNDLVQVSLAAKDAVQELSQDGHDTIDHFLAVITNRGAKIQIAYIDPRNEINRYQGIGNNQFTLNGDGSSYDLRVSWQGTAGKTVSALTSLSSSAFCHDAVQGKIAWNYSDSTTWNEANISRLCAGSEDSVQPASCFNRIMHNGINWGGGTKWRWENALNLCEGTTNADATISCFQGEIQQGHNWQSAIAACER